LCPLIEKELKTPLDAEIRRVMAGNYLSEFAVVLEKIRPRFEAYGIRFTADRTMSLYGPSLRFWILDSERAKALSAN
jgi:hypothetical protein